MTDNLFDPEKKGLLNELDNLSSDSTHEQQKRNNVFTVTLVFSSRVIKINIGLN